MRTRQTLQRLRTYESRNITYLEPDGSWPIVWERARGVHVWDAEGKRYLDLTAAFGVAAAGHANPRVVKAGQKQMGVLLHAMGDVHPHRLKADLAQALSRLTFERWTRGSRTQGLTRGKTIFCNSGFEAVEAGLKTARLATDRPGVVAFTGAYHGLGYGALNATHREHFRARFRDQLSGFARFVKFPLSKASGVGIGELEDLEDTLHGVLLGGDIGAILVEPIQVRGGIHVPPPGFLRLLRRIADEYQVLLILDEIYTGFGRTGKWFACEHEGVAPDVICLGKALSGGFPLSACVGRAEVMDRAWPASDGEAIHTSTFLGHPVGCAMALAQIEEIRLNRLVQRSSELGKYLLDSLGTFARGEAGSPQVLVRGRGLLAGLDLREAGGAPATARALAAVKAMLHRGFILLPEGESSNVISFSPPLTISAAQLDATLENLRSVLAV